VQFAEFTPTQLSLELRQLQKDLEDALKKEQYQPLLNPEFDLHRTLHINQQNEITQRLFQHLQSFIPTSTNTTTTETSNNINTDSQRSPNFGSSMPSKGPHIVYELYCDPEQLKIDTMSKISDLEKKINFLESVIGTKTLSQVPSHFSFICYFFSDIQRKY
jgi:hypothetical protein